MFPFNLSNSSSLLYCDISGDRVVALMEKAWDAKVLAGFRWTEVIWLEYARIHRLPDPYLTECSDLLAVRWVIGFIVYLEDEMNFTGPQIGKSLTNLRGIIIIYGGCVSAFSSESLKVARRSVRNIHASLFAPSILIEDVKKPIVQLPICVEFMDRLREWYRRASIFCAPRLEISFLESTSQDIQRQPLQNMVSTHGHKSFWKFLYGEGRKFSYKNWQPQKFAKFDSINNVTTE